MNRRAPRPGFATLLALSVLVLIGALSAGLVALGNAQLQRTAERQRQAQVEQLLHAGAIAAPRHVIGWRAGDEDKTRTVPVPAALEARGAAVTLWVEQTIPNVERLAHIEVLLDGRPARQRLRYVHDAKGWGLVEAKLAK